MSAPTLIENQTIIENLVREVSLAPMPGHALVVYKLVDGGRVFMAELSPEQQFKEEKTRWWNRFLSNPPSYTAYAVNLNEQLKRKFSHRVLLRNQLYGFDLIFRLRYRIASPRRVVERLSEDPLKQLQNEIVDQINEIVSNEEWDSIKNRFNLLAEDALAHTKKEIDKQAEYWGFAVESIKLEHQLLETDIQTDIDERDKAREIERRKIEADAERRRREIEQQNAIHQADLEHQTALHQAGLGEQRDEVEHQHAVQQAQLEFQRKELELKHQDSLQAQDLANQIARMLHQNMVRDNNLMTQIRTGGADAAVEALKNIAGETNSPRQLEEALNVLQRLAFKQPSASNAPLGDLQSIGASPSAAGLLSAQNEESDKLTKVADLLYRTFQVVREVNYSTAEQARLLSALLHLAAEAMLGAETDDGKIKEYQEKLKEVVEKFSFLPPELERFMRENYRSLKERLK